MPVETELSSPDQALLKLQIPVQNKCWCCFKQPCYKAVCYTALDSKNRPPISCYDVTPCANQWNIPKITVILKNTTYLSMYKIT